MRTKTLQGICIGLVTLGLSACGRVHYDAIYDGGQDADASTFDAQASDATLDTLTLDGDVDAARSDMGLTANVVVDPTFGLSTSERGDTATFTVSLASAPSFDVSIVLSSATPLEASVSPVSLVFTATTWSVPQTVTVTGVDDASVDGDVAFTIVTAAAASADLAYNGLVVADVTGVNADDDHPALRTTTSAPTLITTEAGGIATFTASLTSAPTADVVVPVASSNTLEGSASPLSLTFTALNWNVEQTVTLTGVDDAVADGDQAYNVILGPAGSADTNYNGMSAADVAALNVDDESPGITVTPTLPLTTTEAGGTATYSLTLNSEPTSSVTIPVASLTPSEATAAPASIVFTTLNWSTPQSITVTGVDDFRVDGDISVVIGNGAATSADTDYDGFDAPDVSLMNIDDDVAGITVVPTSGLVTTEAGGTATFNVVLDSEPTGDVTISLASSNSAEGTVAPASLTFTSLNWNLPQTATVTGVNDAIVDADIVYAIVTGDGASTDPIYNGRVALDVSVTNTNDDVWPYVQSTYVKASNPDPNDRFGTSVQISADGNTMAVSANFEESNATGIGGNQLDNSASMAGAVYVFVRTSGVWTQQAYIKASNTNANDRLGEDQGLALSADGNTLAIGAGFEASSATGIGGNQADNSTMYAGAIYVFTRSGATWTQQAYVKASNTGGGDFFGVAVALSADGSTLAAGAIGEKSAAPGVGANEADNSANAAGAVYVFQRTGIVWAQQAYVKSSNPDMLDLFGTQVALSGDGNTLAVGAPGEDSNATGIGGNQIDNSVSGAGAAYLFTRVGVVWSQQLYIKASNPGSNDGFGTSVAVSSDGSTLAVGATGEASNAAGVDGNQADNSRAQAGAVYVFARVGMVWSQQAYVKASNPDASDRFAINVELAADGNTLLVGSYQESSNGRGLGGDQANNSAGQAGAAYVFERSGVVWSQLAYLKASNTEGSDWFGRDVALSSDGATLVVGAPGENSNATGINGNQLDNSISGAGAVYVFDET